MPFAAFLVVFISKVQLAPRSPWSTWGGLKYELCDFKLCNLDVFTHNTPGVPPGICSDAHGSVAFDHEPACDEGCPPISGEAMIRRTEAVGTCACLIRLMMHLDQLIARRGCGLEPEVHCRADEQEDVKQLREQYVSLSSNPETFVSFHPLFRRICLPRGGTSLPVVSCCNPRRHGAYVSF